MPGTQLRPAYVLCTAFIFVQAVLLPANLSAQVKPTVTFGKVSPDDFTIQSPLVDGSSSGVIIADVGHTKFEGNNKGWFSYVFKRQQRVKIIDKKSIDLATVSIFLYKSDGSEEKAEDITATTYNLQDGKVVETKLNTKDIFTEKADKNHFYKKFTLPNVQEGSIVEYSYTVKSDFIFNLPAWQFQHETYPTLWSEFNIVMPSLLSYMTFFQGFHKFHINKSANGNQVFSVTRTAPTVGIIGERSQSFTVSSPVLKQQWVMKDIAQFGQEAFMSSANNYMDKISFQLYKTYDGESFHDVTTNWKTVSDELMKREDFGKPLTEDTGWLDALLGKIFKAGDADLEAARKVYAYVQENFTCTSRYEKFIKTSLQDVVKKKSGNVGELNLLLVALLKRKFHATYPMLLSTRDVGRNSDNYPQLDRLNYVIAMLKIGSSTYYLDATVPYLPFGKLPSQAYNGNARPIGEDTSAVLFDPRMEKQSTVVNVEIAADEKNQLVGSLYKRLGLYESMEAKKQIAKSMDGYKKMTGAGFNGDFELLNVNIDSMPSVDDPVAMKINFKIKADGDADIIYFNPMMTEQLSKNPFHADQRTYPVEMPYTTDETYVLSLRIPAGYKVEEAPKSARVSFNGTDASFEYIVAQEANYIKLRSRTSVNVATFSNEDYQSLRDFFGYIVKKHAEQIVFKKIK